MLLTQDRAPRQESVAVHARRSAGPLVTTQEWILLGIVSLLWIVLAFTTPAFLTAASLQPMLASVAPVAMVGIGMTVVIIAGGIDISVGAGLLLTTAVIAKVLVVWGPPLGAALILALLVGALLGLVNGMLTAFGRIHSIIVTFATANVFLFLALRTLGHTISGIPSTLAVLGGGSAGRSFGIPNSVLITVVVAVGISWYLRNVPGGRHFFAVGGDPEAAELAGIRVRQRVVLAFVMTGVLVGAAACFRVGLGTSTLTPDDGAGFELSVIAAVVIGGTSITGGRGSVLGTLLGALLVQTVASGNTQLGYPSSLANLFAGVLIVIAVGGAQLRSQLRRRRA